MFVRNLHARDDFHHTEIKNKRERETLTTTHRIRREKHTRTHK